MATLYITEFFSMGQDGTGRTSPVPMVPPSAEQVLAISVSSVASAAFSANTTLVRICSDVTCSIAWGTSPTATGVSARIPANVPMDFVVKQGSNFKVAVIANT